MTLDETIKGIIGGGLAAAGALYLVGLGACEGYAGQPFVPKDGPHGEAVMTKGMIASVGMTAGLIIPMIGEPGEHDIGNIGIIMVPFIYGPILYSAGYGIGALAKKLF